MNRRSLLAALLPAPILALFPKQASAMIAPAAPAAPAASLAEAPLRGMFLFGRIDPRFHGYCCVCGFMCHDDIPHTDHRGEPGSWLAADGTPYPPRPGVWISNPADRDGEAIQVKEGEVWRSNPHGSGYVLDTKHVGPIVYDTDGPFQKAIACPYCLAACTFEPTIMPKAMIHSHPVCTSWVNTEDALAAWDARLTRERLARRA
jgi:hypothetical protein